MTYPVEFKRKRDKYYITVILYLIFLVIYYIITTIANETNAVAMYKDPVIFLVLLCVIYSIGRLVSHICSSPRIEIQQDKILFKAGKHIKCLNVCDIDLMFIKRSRIKMPKSSTAGDKIFIRHKNKWHKLKAKNYENEKELYGIMKGIQAIVQRKD